MAVMVATAAEAAERAKGAGDGAPPGQGCREVTFEAVPYALCTFHADAHDIRLFWQDARGVPFYGFDNLAGWLRRQGLRLRFAMNAGMFTPRHAPAGLYVENGRVLRPINLRKGWGNFHLLPNGVFWLAEGRAGVAESKAFARRMAKGFRPAFATQSGPLLVIAGRLHPRFRRDSPSRKIRNGVGVAADGRTVHMAMSLKPVNFHAFARFFRDRLKVPDALFLDGGLSQLWAPEIGRKGFRLSPLGPMIAVVERE